jgi:hypothetical protein
MRTRRTSRLSHYVMGIAAIASGAVMGAAGTAGWISLLTIPSVVVAGLGVLFLGVVPIVVGLGLIWSGINALVEPVSVVDLLPEARFVAAAGDGATREQIAYRLDLAPADWSSIEQRLDVLVIDERLELVLTDAGDLLYFAVPSRLTSD